VIILMNGRDHVGRLICLSFTLGSPTLAKVNVPPSLVLSHCRDPAALSKRACVGY
jgi:hypothetical protein